MKVLLVHNRYGSSAPSGEDEAVGNERRMLENHGIEVAIFDRCNDEIDDLSWAAKATVAINTIWSRQSRAKLGAMIGSFRPDIVHVHNTFALLSPSVYGACRREGVPVVQTLHNFRFFCPAALFLRQGKPCEACVDRGLLQSVRHRCYRNSVGATATLATMLALHRTLGTYSNGIDRYIALTDFARRKAIKGGVLEDRIVVKPNFIGNPPFPGAGGGGYVLYVGRLLEGKGAETLVKAWRKLPGVRLKILGDGALRPQLEGIAVDEGLSIEFAGRQPKDAVLQAIAGAEFLIVPSECYEGFPMVIAESYACGTPVLASRIGSLEELVDEDVTGAKFTAADPDALAAGVVRLLADPSRLRGMRTHARAYFDKYLTEESNFIQLMAIYSSVRDEFERHAARSA
jgi:glycosyltransferase involved in cell wall biosynthesis